MGGSSPNSDSFLFLEIVCFFVLFFLLYTFQKKLVRVLGDWGLPNPISDFRNFFNLRRPLREMEEREKIRQTDKIVDAAAIVHIGYETTKVANFQQYVERHLSRA